MNEPPELRNLRAVLDAVGSSPRMSRIAIYSRMASAGFPDFAGELRRAVEAAVALEAASTGDLGLLTYPSVDPSIKAEVELMAGARVLLMTGDTDAIPDHSAAMSTESASVTALLVTKYLGDWDIGRAEEFARARNATRLKEDLVWNLAVAVLAYRTGDEWMLPQALSAVTRSLAASEFGLYDERFWRMLDRMTSRDPGLISMLCEVIVPSFLGRDPETTVQFAAGMSLYVARHDEADEWACRRVLDSLLVTVGSDIVLQTISSRFIDQCLSVAQDLCQKLVHMSEAEALPPQYDLAELKGELARIRFARGRYKENLAAQRLLRKSTEKKTYTRLNPDTENLSDGRLQAMPVARLVDQFSLPSFSIEGLGEALPIRPSVMSRVDTRPVRFNAGKTTTFCSRLQGASVISGSRRGSIFWYVKMRENRLICDGLNVHPRFHFGSTEERLHALSPQGEALVEETFDQRIVRVPGEAVLIGGIDNYYHWTTEYLPKLATLNATVPDIDQRDPVFIVNDNLASWQIASLTHAGIGLDRLFRLKGGHEALCSQLYVPSMPETRQSVEFLRDLMGIEASEPTGQRLYVSRLDTVPERRRIADEEALAEQLQARGYDILVPTEVDFDAQIMKFAEADVIIGAHGAALTNLIYARPGAIAIEITNSFNHRYDFFKQIAETVGVRHRRHRGLSESVTLEPENAAVNIDVDDLLAMVEWEMKREQAQQTETA